ncbi:glycosyltransferase family 9 protein [Gluconobacter cerinus]|uniref:glycosyltransferase family 9 protein n=1 Tax=Gluconobacter cerinus TaxID=38307 RepID=UPI001B8B1CAA|nr:glycosyltransferase family 9 protein [Gluconobacter cerinus]
MHSDDILHSHDWQYGNSSRSIFGIAERWSDLAAYQAFDKKVPIERILLIKADAIGDFILSLDAMLAMRQAFPNAHLTLACGPWNVEIARALDFFDEIHVVNFFASRADIPRPPFSAKLLNGLEKKFFDLIVDVRIDIDTRVMFPHLQATYKCGFDSGSSELNRMMTMWLPHGMPPGTDMNLGMHQTLLMKRLADSVIGLFRTSPDIGRLLRERIAQPAAVDLGFAQGRILVAINTSSGRLVKNWPLSRYQALISWLCNKMKVAVFLLGGPDQKQDSDYLLETCQTPFLASFIGQTTLRESMDLLTRADLYIGNDTGLTHMAARMGVSSVSIFSGIDPTAMWAPVGKDVTVLRVPTPCSSCHILQLEECNHKHSCILDITQEDVRAAVRNKIIAAHRRRMTTGVIGA